MFISNQTKYKEILSTATWAAIHPQVSELVWLRKLYAFKYFRLIGFTKGQITLRKTVVTLPDYKIEIDLTDKYWSQGFSPNKYLHS